MEIQDLKGAIDAHHKATTDVLGELKGVVDETRKRLDGIETKHGRPNLGDGKSVSEDTKAFVKYLRTGDKSELKAKAFATDDNPNGGYAVPEDLSREIYRLLVNVSPVRSYARVVPAANASFTQLISAQNATASWTAERGARAETNTPEFKAVNPPSGGLFARPKVTNWFLNDAMFDVGAFLTENVALQFGRSEGAAFITGDGINKPRGFLTGTTPVTTDDATRAFGTLQYIPTGAAGTFHATTPGDVLFTTISKLKAGYRAGAVWMMNSATQAVARTWKSTGGGDYLLRDGLANREPPQLCGFPVAICEDMPDIAANTFPIAFGNFQAGYLIIDIGPLLLIVDQVTVPGETIYHLERRVGGSVFDSNALKLIKVAAA